MKQYAPKDIRNFAIVGHQASGKTMLVESMLRCAGRTNRLGSIEAGSTVSDYHVSEKQRKISVHASIMNAEWMDKKLNILDTPGYLDFISEALGALRVGDFAMVTVNASAGPEMGTSKVWEFADRFELPRVIVVNGADKEHVDFDLVLESLRERFGRNVFPMTLPLDAGPGFHRVLDVLRNGECVYAKDASGKFTEKPVSGEDAERVKELHRELIEFVAESDDTLLEKFFDEGTLSEETMRAGIHTAVQTQAFIPLFVTSAETNVGVARLLDFVAKYGSSPVDRKKVPAFDESGNETLIALDDPEPACYVFKTLSEAHVGELSFFRMYSGSIKAGIDVYNSDRRINERLGQIFHVNGHERTSADFVGPGDIGAAVKLRDTHTGNTLSSVKRHVTLPPVAYPKPNIHGALRLKAKGDEDRLGAGLSTLHEEDPTFLYRNDPETRETVLSGQGELHLAIILERLKRRFNVDVELVEPRVPFRETIKKKADSKYRHKKQSGGAGQFAEVWMRIEPLARDSGVEFTNSLVGQNVDRVFVPSVEKGVNAACNEGVLAGYRIVDLKVDFYDGKMHPVDSKDVAFQIAGKAAFREAFLAAKPCLLEPICNVTIRVPENYVGDVMGDISSRRGRIQGVDAESGLQVISAQVPQVELYRYSTALRSITGGQGVHEEAFSHYEEMDSVLEQKVIAEAKAAKEASH